MYFLFFHLSYIAKNRFVSSFPESHSSEMYTGKLVRPNAYIFSLCVTERPSVNMTTA